LSFPESRGSFGGNCQTTRWTFNWREVTRLFAFKRDIFAVDLICFAFELHGFETLEVNEHMQGWNTLVAAVPIRLPGALAQEEWFQKVAFPAFALCWTQIYPRPTISCAGF